MRPLLITLVIAPLLAGCLGSAPPVPRDHYYRLLVPMPAESAETLLPGTMTVELLQADGLLRERPLLYSAAGGAYELQQHNYHYWNDVPPRMLQDQMVGYLRRSGAAVLVVTPDTRVRADYRVSGKAKRFERLMGDGAPKVAVEIELTLQRLSDDALLVVDTYSAEEATADDSVGASIEALNAATASVFDAFLGDLRQAAATNTALAPR
ncbi:MAG TPA: ABC-type transport auxiliary lipoprotein family protein [Kiloniellaceae bacterium]|nr:ABC-type transport auxiliary lipoprotein family protein [Kiloniellaceae bacterium]